ncbi:zinc-dependent alcohol dehydrogenase family protein [Streptomyces sp. NBS 14/10]|uniref:zinc-dependent alcohol dehydrogenase family protein n=1 Tax=Streptomyces sp. NBS 14/10 TaxID=1945643 RepID=UPI000B7D2A43|nr:zinc-dependent alcohol dehydrogenase family protein [Streptomyces sp. NBS 14/10]KAK1184364.1 zinc-dependent alcohol dehydrogenase family protein [Streptomyces sp. NBS 14/10]
MKAVVYDAPRSFTIREIPTPQAGPGEIRIRVLQAGVCGTDLHLHDGQFMAAFPLIPGHEAVGVIDQIGEGVEGFTLGEQATINPNASCGNCFYCRAGRNLMCTNLTGMGSNLPGAFAEYVTAPAAQVFSVEGMHPDTAVFVEPASCVMHGVDVLRPAPGSSVLVLGAGPTGQLLAQLVASSGAAHVTVAAPTAFKLDTARALGADQTFVMNRADLPGDVVKLRELSGGDGYDIVIDATGSADVCAVCVPLTRNGGTTVFYGVTDENDLVQVSPYDIFRRELTIKGSFAEINSFPAAIAALRSGRAKTDGIITHRFKLEDYAKALQTLRHDKTAHKVVLTL